MDLRFLVSLLIGSLVVWFFWGRGDKSSKVPELRPAPKKPRGPAPAGTSSEGEDSEAVAWSRQKMLDCAALRELEDVTPGQAQSHIGRLFEAHLGLLRTSMVFGFVVPDDDAQEAKDKLLPLSADLLNEWQDGLEHAHGEAGLCFFLEVSLPWSNPENRGSAFAGLQFRGHKRHALRRLTFDRSPVSDEELAALFDAANPPAPEKNTDRADYVQLEMEGEAIVGARIGIDWEADFDPHRLLEGLLVKPEAQALRTLKLGLWACDENDYGQALEILSAHEEGLQALEQLVIGDYERPEEMEISWTELGDFGALWARLPSLQRLRFQGGGLELGDAVHERLEELKIESAGLGGSALRSLATARFPALHSLTLWLGTEERGFDGKLKDFLPFFDNSHYSNLRHLGLENSEFSDALAKATVQSDLAGRLEHLSFALGTLSDAGAQSLIDGASRFENLNKLDLAENFLSQECIERVRKAFAQVEVVIGEQDEPDDYGEGEVYYYVSVNE